MNVKYKNNPNKLKVGQKAPLFSARDYKGNAVNLKDYQGKKVLLSFHVFGSCPFCNLRVRELSQKYAEWSANGLEMIHVFPSSEEVISKYAGKDNPPFAVLSDPQKKLYEMYDMQRSVVGMLKGFLNVKKLFQAFKVVSLFSSLSNNDAAMHQLPAEFLIDEAGRIDTIHYGANTSDNLALSEIERFIAPSKPLAEKLTLVSTI